MDGDLQFSSLSYLVHLCLRRRMFPCPIYVVTFALLECMRITLHSRYLCAPLFGAMVQLNLRITGAVSFVSYISFVIE
jgi:hypothetical protein